VAHDHLRLHLTHGLERDADDDEDRRAAEGSVGRLREVEVRDEDRRRDGDGSEEQNGLARLQWGCALLAHVVLLRYRSGLLKRPACVARTLWIRCARG